MPTRTVRSKSQTLTHGAYAHFRALAVITGSVQLFQKHYQATMITGKTKTLQPLPNLIPNSQKVALVTTDCLNRNHVIAAEGVISMEL